MIKTVGHPLQEIHGKMSAPSHVLDQPDLSRSTDQLRLLFEVSDAIASHRDLTALFRDLARRLPAVVPFEVIALFLHDPEKNVMRVHMLGTAEADRIPPGLEVPVAESFSGIVFTTQEPVVVRSPEDASRFPQRSRCCGTSACESFCVLPLTTIMRRLGAIGFGSSEPVRLRRSELEFLAQVARQVAVAVDNVLHDESNKSASSSSARNAIVCACCSRFRSRSRRIVTSMICFTDLNRAAAALVPFDFINLVLHDPVRNVMRLQILDAPASRHDSPGLETPVDESPSGLVWQTQQPLMVDDLAQETRFAALRPLLLENGVRSFCAVPLTTALRRLGTLGFGSLQPNAYRRSRTSTFMQQVAKQVAVAVDNVLHDESARSAQEQLARERDRLQLLLDVNNAVVSHLGHGRDVRGD